ncbi:MAG: 1-acyl-sn-glycerol-3-phosphate acyltransferase [Rickettsia endosymbiont of Ixodes persulcatus]|nr:1-acyl-sn-glycerol-3-phosphate acyltransferase [Rickettsia endosymbiont of Ixodes persulcatus]
MRATVSKNNNEEKSRGILYVCNHRTLLDPIYVSIALMKPAVTAAIYSLSTITERFSPIKTVRLTRNKEKDSKMMEKQLSQGNLVVCPEGTTCREPYLLRFSPLFAETTDEIVPIAMDIQASMFYGTTASGFKCLDPVFLLMNPTTSCSINILEKLPRGFTCGVGGKSKFEVANYVQAMIAEALRFECTNLTRKDKYMILAGNEGKM